MGFEKIADFHFKTMEYTIAAEWGPIIKAFNNEIIVTAH